MSHPDLKSKTQSTPQPGSKTEAPGQIKVIIVSGLSGSGKSIALNTLEDLDYYCIDNLPVGMLKAMSEQINKEWGQNHNRIAVGIDARNSSDELRNFPDLLDKLNNQNLSSKIFFLKADNNTLLKRFSETRRKHPLTSKDVSLADAIELERQLLAPIAENADLYIDTTHTNIYQLRDLIRERVTSNNHEPMSLLFQSFGYKHGIPGDADFVFDVRCLPNPHWESTLRPLTGKDDKVIEYLEGQPTVIEMLEQIKQFMNIWAPRFESESRSYMTVAVGCTGGQHRSVYMVESLGKYFGKQRNNVAIRHRELS